MLEPHGANNDVYLLSYEWRKQSYKEDKPILDELIKEGLVTVVEKDLKTIIFRYHPPKQGGKRKGAGRTPKFNEATTTFSCRVPVCINSVKVDSKKRSKVNSQKEVFRIV